MVTDKPQPSNLLLASAFVYAVGMTMCVPPYSPLGEITDTALTYIDPTHKICVGLQYMVADLQGYTKNFADRGAMSFIARLNCIMG